MFRGFAVSRTTKTRSLIDSDISRTAKAIDFKFRILGGSLKYYLCIAWLSPNWAWSGSPDTFENFTPPWNISATATARDFKFCKAYTSWPREVLGFDDYSCPQWAWTGSRDTFQIFTPFEVSLQRLQLDFKFRIILGRVMSNYPPNGRGQGHVTHFYILWPRPYRWSWWSWAFQIRFADWT